MTTDVPFAFVFRPELLMRGDALEIVAVSLLTLARLAAVSFGLAGRGRLTVSGAVYSTCLVTGGVLLADRAVRPPASCLGSGACPSPTQHRDFVVS